MQISPCGVLFIAEFESFKDHVYLDSVGVPTIGFGTTTPAIIAAYRGRTCTIEEAQGWFLTDIDQEYGPAVNALGRWFSQPQWDSLCSFAYNLGSHIFDPGRSIRVAIDSGDAAQVGTAMRLYDKAGNPPQPLPGLTRRRDREARLFADHDYGIAGCPAPPARKDEDLPQIDVKAGGNGHMQYEARVGTLRLWSGRKGVWSEPDKQVVDANGCNLHIEAKGDGDPEYWLDEDLWANDDFDGQAWKLPGPAKAGGVCISAIGPNGVNASIVYDE